MYFLKTNRKHSQAQLTNKNRTGGRTQAAFYKKEKNNPVGKQNKLTNTSSPIDSRYSNNLSTQTSENAGGFDEDPISTAYRKSKQLAHIRRHKQTNSKNTARKKR